MSEATPPADPARDRARAHGSRRWILAALAATAVVVAAGVVAALARSPGPPGPPLDPKAVASTCADDPCRKVRPVVTVTWTPPPEGGTVTGYRVQRDGQTLPGAGSIDPGTHVVIDHSVVFGQTYGYRITAFGESGESASTSAVTARPVLPPLEAAQLDGVFHVWLEVRTARSLGSILGMENPVAGKQRQDRWTFRSRCSAERAACPATWENLDGDLVPDGLRWRGTVAGPDADCGGGTKVAAPISFDLRTVDAAAEGSRWRIEAFTGTVEVRFTCPGFAPSVGNLEVTAVRT